MLHHRALEGEAAVALEAAALSDRQRLAVLLQGAALLAHLRNAGCRLASGWQGSGLAADGTLCLPPPRAGRDPSLPQERLAALVAVLFGAAEVAGRGEARRIVRELGERWSHALVPVSPDDAVHELLEAAPFLWADGTGVARRALVGEVERDGRRWLSIAGGSLLRRRLAALAEDRCRAEELLAATAARTLGEPRSDRSASELVAAGRLLEALDAWRRQPPQGEGERLAQARALCDLGQFASALASLRGLDTAAARLLAFECQVRLGELGAARLTLRGLEGAADSLPPVAGLALAELALRLLANLGETRSLDDWVAFALRQGRRGELAWRARLVVAGAAWDRGDQGRLAAELERCQGAVESPQLAWRWYAAASLAARARGDAPAGEQFLRRGLGASRRLLRPFEAGELWNELGICRAAQGDLAGAERAFRHTQRLLGRCQGPRRTTLALSNLAEVRLRRGRLAGVRQLLERVTAENRAAGNVRGGIQDRELWARYELAHGRAQAALEQVDRARQLVEQHRVTWRLDVLALLAARALGWLGRSEEAAAELGEVGPEAWAELEPEEAPAVLALAGQREQALERAAAGPFLHLWSSLLAGGEAGPQAWSALEDLEPFRAARWLFDAELIAPGRVPGDALRAAATTLRQLGASAFSNRLEAREQGAWQVVARYLAEPRPRASELPERLGELFAALSTPPPRLDWLGASSEQVLIAGEGGPLELSAPLAAGRLVLAAARLDDVLQAAFHLAHRDLTASGWQPEAPAVAPARAQSSGFVGESPLLAAAIERLLRLAAAEMPLLILGESGTGKELVARAAHRASSRREAPFVALNCAAVSESLLLSDLFGHVRGAFTGADRDRAGVFEAAQGGTVFLDEIGDLPLAAQGMLLRVLQEGEVRRVGESLPRKVRVRVLAATHRDLSQMVQEKLFRQDLFFRLKVGAVELPPLRERGHDVLLLARHFLAKAGGPTSPPPRISPAAEQALLAHRWPGNVRELENVVQVAAALATDGVIDVEHLDLPAEPAREPLGDYHRAIEALRRSLVSSALEQAAGNRAEAARRLGLTRQAFSYLVRELRLG